MDDRTRIFQNGHSHNHDLTDSDSVDIYPLSCYYFGFRDSVPFRNETVSDRVSRMKAKYDAYGMRKCVAAVVLIFNTGPELELILLELKSIDLFTLSDANVEGEVELFKHPHILLLQVRNSIYKLPGGCVRLGESDIDCLKRKLSSKLSAIDEIPEWEVGECLGIWWRPDFGAPLLPYLPADIQSPKECTKLFLVKLPESRRFIVPRNFRLLAVPLCQLHGNDETYGPVICGVPELLSKFSFNFVEP